MLGTLANTMYRLQQLATTAPAATCVALHPHEASAALATQIVPSIFAIQVEGGEKGMRKGAMISVLNA